MSTVKQAPERAFSVSHVAPEHGIKRRCLARVSSVMLGLVLVTGCLGVHPPAPTAVPPTLTAPPPASPTPTETASPTATNTPLPSPTPTRSPTPLPLSLALSLDPPEVEQGHTCIVQVTASRTCRVVGSILERPLRFVSRDGLVHLAFAGVRATDELGELPLEIEALSEDRQAAHLMTALTVLDGRYGRETVHLTPEVGALLDPAITGPELLRLAHVYALATSAVHWEGPFGWPFRGPITSHFGTRREYSTGLRSYHTGLDIDGVTGDGVVAPAKGIVVLADRLQVRGGAMILDHGAGVLSGYYHLSEINVDVGQVLERGDPLGKMGATGVATGSHLHWELRVNGVAVNPAEWTERAFGGP